MLERELTVHDPRTGEEVGRVPIASAERCADALSAARDAAPGWARTPAAERGAALHAAAAAVRAAADELAELNTAETGKLRGDASGGVEAGAARSSSTRSSGRCTGAAACTAPGTPPT